MVVDEHLDKPSLPVLRVQSTPNSVHAVGAPVQNPECCDMEKGTVTGPLSSQSVRAHEISVSDFG